ncbi:MAG TPA: molybdopterin-dependent oxidoreductase [Herbaspirillum sp.]|nr:molybdopterin-dependent oxidoreductase [Herbaspirillum sp.]
MPDTTPQHQPAMLRNNKVIAGLLCWFAFAAAQAQDEMLTVTGSIMGHTDGHTNSYVFSENDLFALGQHIIKTSTSWTPESSFTGPRLSVVLSKAGAIGTHVEVHTLDDYTYTISVDEADRYGAILAHTMNGKKLQVSDFGPLFLIYPRDQYPHELRTPVAEAKFIWQIRKLIVK